MSMFPYYRFWHWFRPLFQRSQHGACRMHSQVWCRGAARCRSDNTWSWLDAPVPAGASPRLPALTRGFVGSRSARYRCNHMMISSLCARRSLTSALTRAKARHTACPGRVVPDTYATLAEYADEKPGSNFKVSAWPFSSVHHWASSTLRAVFHRMTGKRVSDSSEGAVSTLRTPFRQSVR